jgi:hypothetical protein
MKTHGPNNSKLPPVYLTVFGHLLMSIMCAREFQAYPEPFNLTKCSNPCNICPFF